MSSTTAGVMLRNVPRDGRFTRPGLERVLACELLAAECGPESSDTPKDGEPFGDDDEPSPGAQEKLGA
jgi:hypothetical protein